MQFSPTGITEVQANFLFCFFKLEGVKTLLLVVLLLFSPYVFVM
jgi:hypothetical protein